jgi:hypothetical protein
MLTCLECIGAAIASIVGLSAAMSAAVQDRVRSVNANYFFDRRDRQAQDIHEAYARASPRGGSSLGGFSVYNGMSY